MKNTVRNKFHFLVFSVFITLNFHYIIIFDPDQLQRSGSLIVVFAIVNFSLDRSRYEGARDDWRYSKIVSHVNHLHRLREVDEYRLNLTADSHTFQIAQLLNAAGAPNPYGLETKESLEALANDLDERMRNEELQEKHESEIKKTRELDSQFKEVEESFFKLPGVILRYEIALLIIGTIQWGYGDLFLKWMYKFEFVSDLMKIHIRPIYPF